MKQKFNSKLAIAMVKASTNYECGNIDFAEDLNAISVYSKSKKEFGSWDIVSALEVCGFKCYARNEHIDGHDKIAIRVF